MKKPVSVLFYVPNLICYIRLIFIIYAACIFRHSPLLAVTFFITSEILDVLDGYSARLLEQTSYTGAILDYTIDRAAICLFSVMMAILYPNLWLLFAGILMLDTASHITHIYASLFLKRKHHKELSASNSYLLNLYYSNKAVLFLCCFFHNNLFTFIYLNYFFPNQPWVYIGGLICLPGFIFKTIIHVIQLKVALQSVIELDEESRQLEHG